ncbi:Hpt domain-containing protein [Phreatobacter stygius]|uniref:Hpt domain-containing protein n=1 Tax=Phreatobacter stygius TaxID=1940610 RepID=UPI001B8C30C2|nr:Hpt domain-containing protein [Phreatobacter stygius]
MTDDPSGHSSPVDLAHLARQTFGDRDLELEVLALFERQSRAMIERLRQATTAKDWAYAAHTLIGSARGIGAFAVAEAAEAVEGAKLDYLSSQAIAELERLEAEVAEANAFIAELRKVA